MNNSLQTILHSYHLLKHIFEFLPVDDQLQLLDICDSFRYVIVDLIWKVKFRTMHLYQTPYVTIITNGRREGAGTVGDQPPDDFMELNKIKQSKIGLKTHQCKRFIVANSSNVQFLNVCSEYYDFKGSLGVTLNKVQIFDNLLQLSYYKMVVTDEQLKAIGTHCRKLQRLELIECYCQQLNTLIPGDNMSVANFVNMTRLEVLIVQSDASLTAPQNEMEYDILLDLLNELQLKCLRLKNMTIIDSHWGEEYTELRALDCSRLEILDPGCISDEFWPKFKHYLKLLHNLRELSIKVSNCNTDFNLPIVELLAATCKHLEKLSIENFDLHVEDFCVFAQLKHLSLSCCGGLTFANLQEIMGGLQRLESLTLINTRVLGVINHIYVSPSLQSITIDTILFTIISEAFQKSLNKFENLHTLNWLNGDINDNWIIDKCPNLRVLNIPNPYLLRRVVFTMKSLQEFTFTSCKGLSWRFIWILVKNLTLRRLNLQTHDTITDHKDLSEYASKTKTSLRLIIIPFGIFKAAEHFWLDLLDTNEHLKILFYGTHPELLNVSYVHNLMKHMPARVKHIKVCGFSIDIKDILDNVMDAIHHLNIYTSHFRSRNMKFTMEL